MENRNRDKLSHNTRPTQAGDVNRETSRKQSGDSSVDFGEKIGRSEKDLEREPSRRSGVTDSSGMKGSTGTGRTGSTGMGKGSRSSSDDQIDSGDRSKSERH